MRSTLKAAGIAFGLIFMLAGQSPSFGQSPPPDPAALDLAHDILAMTNTAENAKIVIDAMIPLVVDQLKRNKADIPDAVIKNFIATFRTEMTAAVPRLLDLEAEVYTRHFTTEELRGIVNFYHTDLGKKLLQENPLILRETFPIAQAWGFDMGERAARDTLAKLRSQGVPL